MMQVALRMLIGNSASFIGVVFGIFLATLLISQQSAIFLGLVSLSYRTVTDIPAPNIWVMDPVTESDEKLRLMPENYLDIVRGVKGVEWAVPLNYITLPMITSNGSFEMTQIYGVDDATLIGAPVHMIEGDVSSLHREGGVIVDTYSANGSLATTNPDGTKTPLKIGDTFEINNHRAVVVGISKLTRGFFPQPIIFTSNQSFRLFSSAMSHKMGFILAKSSPGNDLDEVVKRINAHSMLKALTHTEFESVITDYFLKTGILINFGLSVLLGLIIGFSISGQIFYIMTLQNLMYYALIKSMGGGKNMILKMVTFQALVVGVIGYLLGTGATLLWGQATKGTTLAFLFPWQLLLFTAFIVFLICVFTAALSIRKIFRVDPKVLMGT